MTVCMDDAGSPFPSFHYLKDSNLILSLSLTLAVTDHGWKLWMTTGGGGPAPLPFGRQTDAVTHGHVS